MARRRTGTRVIGIIFRAFFTLLIIGVVGILFWRIFSSGDPKSMDTLAVDRKTYEAYEENGKLTMWYQEQNNITKAEKNYGYFAVTDWYYIEEAEQIQLTFRYNNSTIDHLVKDYGLDEKPDRSEILYDVTLYVAYDLTPDNTKDNDGNDPESVKFVRYTAELAGTEQKNLYNYRKYIIDGVKIAEGEHVLAVYADFYYVGDINYEEEAYGTLCLYDYATKKRDRALTKDDKKALEAYGASVD